MSDQLKEIWKDQADFNLNFFPVAVDFPERSRQTKEFLIHMMSEMDELLRCTEFKPHRKIQKKPNLDQAKAELIDIHKYWISLCQVWGFTPEEMMKEYWRKSMVCRQRYSEEFCQNLDGQLAIVDIDGVIADYHLGISNWIKKVYPELTPNVQKCLENRTWIDASGLEIDEQRWQEIKHQFRTTGGKISLPTTHGAQDFLETCSMMGLKVILLTSRPIDKYPNIYTDTLVWLKEHDLYFDFLWWAHDKKEAVLSENIRHRIKFAIDDDIKYIKPYSDLGLKCYWLDWMNQYQGGEIPENVRRISSLREILNEIKVEG